MSPNNLGSLEPLGWKVLEQSYVLFTKIWTPVQLLLAAIGVTWAITIGIAHTLQNIFPFPAKFLGIAPLTFRDHDSPRWLALMAAAADKLARACQTV
jgi:hypothetical protein